MSDIEGYDWSMLEDAVEYDFTGWQPEEGDMVIGTVAYTSEGESVYGKYPMVAVITKEGRPVMIHAFHMVLASALDRQKPVAGDKIAVKYIGRKPSKVAGNDPMHVYNVVVHHAGGGLAMTAPEGVQALGAGDEAATAQEAAQSAETAPWDDDALAPATKVQRDAIDKMLNQQGLEPHDWITDPLDFGSAGEFIRELQS